VMNVPLTWPTSWNLTMILMPSVSNFCSALGEQ